MIKQELKTKIEDTLSRMGCKNIEFANGVDNFTVVKFDCEPLISFKADLEDWTYSGIQLNDSGTEQKYKIEFRKI